MAKTYRKNIRRTLMGTKSRFLAIFSIVALGVGFLAGLMSTSPDIEDSMEVYLDSANLYDFRVVSTLGVTEEDVEAVRALPDVAAVRGACSADLFVEVAAGDVIVARAHSLPADAAGDPAGADTIDSLLLLEGRWPENPGECVVESGGSMVGQKFGMGETFVCTADNVDLEDKLAQKSFTIVGKVRDAYYFSYEREPASVGDGSVGAVFYVPQAAFAYSTYTELYGTVAGARELMSLDADYKDKVAAVTDEVKGIADARAAARYEEIRADAQAEIDDAKAEYTDAKADADRELADAAEELADGREKLADGEQELADGQQEYDDGVVTLAENEQKLADGQKAIADAMQELADGQRQYDEGAARLAGGETELADARKTLDAYQKQYDEGKAALDAGQKQYEEGEALYAAGLEAFTANKKEYEAGLAKYEAGETEYAAGLAQYEEGETQYAAGLAQYEEGETQYAAGLAQYETGEKGYAELKALGDGQAGYEAGLDAMVAAGAAPDRQSAEALVVQTAQALAGLEEAKVAFTPAQAAWQAAWEALPPETDPDTDPAALAAKAAANEIWAGWRAGLIAFAPALADTLPETLADPLTAAALGQAAAAAQEEIAAVNAEVLLLYTAKQQIDAGVQALMAAQGLTEKEARALFTPEALEKLRKTLDAAKKELEDSRKTLDATQKTLAGSRKTLDATKEKLGAARKTLDETKAALAAGKTKLDAGEAELAQNRAKLDAAKATLEASANQLAAAKAELDTGWGSYYQNLRLLEDSKKQLADAKTVLDNGFATLTDKQSELADAQRKIGDARKTLADAKTDLAEARKTLAEKKQELLDGETDYATAKADAEKELADAKTKIDDAQAELDTMETGKWYVWNRENNVSFSSFRGNVNKVEALAKVFPVFFFLVAALVVLTTMTRMVEEERLQIGTMKALGYGKGTIMAKYLVYSMAAACSGAFAGLAVGFAVFPTVIWNAYTMMYYMPEFRAPWRLNYALLSGGSLILCALLATVSACRATLRATPAELMRPRAPKAGKRVLLEYITPVWSRLSFTYKVTVRNLMRYKKRFWMTVIGVAGCTALLVTGFGISDSINGIITKQYEDVYVYDLMTTVAKPEDTERGEVYEYLFGTAAGGAITGSVATATEKVDETAADGSTVEAYLMVPRELDTLDEFIHLHERVSRRQTPLTDAGIVLTEKLADVFGVKAGDTVTLRNADGAEAEFPVGGVCENYVYNYIYISPALYEQGFGAAPEWNAVLSCVADTGKKATAAVSASLLAMDAVSSATFTADTTKTVLNMLNSINAIVLVVVICAAALALVVLYNLTNINIAERVKEIATIKVLGFYDKEVNAYVMRESVALSMIGALLGLFGGIALHRFVILTVEVDAVMFGRTIDFSSYVYALVLTMLFSMIVNLIMDRKLKKISMVESMKAPE